MCIRDSAPVLEEQVLGQPSHHQAGDHAQTQMEDVELTRKDDPIQEKQKECGDGIHGAVWDLKMLRIRAKGILPKGQPRTEKSFGNTIHFVLIPQCNKGIV